MTAPSNNDLLIIGASAGGPAAFAAILGKLPANFPAAIVIAQHLDAVFVQTFAQWLGQQSPFPVGIAMQGDHLTPGKVLLADSNKHLIFTGRRRLGYTPHPEDSHFHPSIDVLFESAAKLCGPGVVAVLLTGMGRDGARGLKALRDTGATTIAQDADSSAVYGMPKAAAEALAAKEILPLDSIPGRLTTLFQQNGKR
jgi:two-component system, chemotaxis family, response regulator WspF